MAPQDDRRHSNEWPTTWRRDTPELLDWRLTKVEMTMDEHQDRLKALERRPHLPSFSSLPWMQIVGLLALLGLGVTGRFSPETIELMQKLLPGR